MFLKSNFENDNYLQASLNGSNAVPIETLLQAPDIIEVSNDVELIKTVLLESKVRILVFLDIQIFLLYKMFILVTHMLHIIYRL